MIERKKKILILQLSLLVLGVIIIFTTYLNNENPTKNKILLDDTEKKISEELKGKKDQNTNSNTFFNIEYSGLDFSGNRFILKSSEATTLIDNSELVNLKDVIATFYFKDDTVLTVKSKYGLYNSRTLDMKFSDTVEASYVNNILRADNAEYSNSSGELMISNKVKVNSPKGNLLADRLTFDIKNQVLDIDSFNENKINANIITK